LLLSDEYIQFGYFLYLWVDIGNGARYGLVNQYISTMVSLVGFGIVIHQNSFWLSHPAVAYGLWLGILMVPLYVMVFRRRLQTANQELQAAYLEMKSLAVRDSLTGLPNRSFLYERLNQAIADARRFRRSFTVLYLDIDNFKTINDTFGHPAGDTALQKVGAILRAMTRQGDTVARMGGDEFVILLSEISIADARHIADAIRDAIGAQAGQCPMTTSIGMATYPECAEETQTLIRCADEALYAAKRRGKNKVVLYSDGPTSVESMVPE
jgi:diguanylate cyclase (GGDEF)-like protein